MAPAAYRRIVYAGEDAQDMYRVGSSLVTMAARYGLMTEYQMLVPRPSKDRNPDARLGRSPS
jgi:hypothetical protein